MKRILFTYLKSFSVTGGIEKFNRAFMRGLTELADENKISFTAVSPYDSLPDENYISKKNFVSFNGNKLKYLINILKIASGSDLIVVGHINLALIGLFVKILYPRINILLVAHGIEVWRNLSYTQSLFLNRTDKILCVSNYTGNRIIEKHKVKKGEISIFRNTLDPFFRIPESLDKPEYLLRRYSINRQTKIFFTLTRINSAEGFKGYDIVLQALTMLENEGYNFIYILGGKYEPAEKARIDGEILKLGLTGKVIMPGYIKDEEITDYYLLADVFVMPSKKEGFGIVFIEALACGLSVVAGNKDGSPEALMNGELGKLINPDNPVELKDALINTGNISSKSIQKKAIDEFGFPAFKSRMSRLFNTI